MSEVRIFQQVPRLLYGPGTVGHLGDRLLGGFEHRIFVVDSVHRGSGLVDRLPVGSTDSVEWFPAGEHEPSTDQVDEIRDRIAGTGLLPDVIVGVGGGSTMDVAKAVSVMLTNPGSSSAYQGWDLVGERGIYKVGVPTLSGSGAEASRTAVLMGEDRKFGINSDFSMFDALVLDSELLAGVPATQRFYSGMDCYIHCVESLDGTMINQLARGYAMEGLELCLQVFLGDGTDEQLMTASFMGGVSIVNSEVGICHALSYGLSMELGYRHGHANCVAFDVLEEYYGDRVIQFREMLRRQGLELSKGSCLGLDEAALGRMVEMTLRMERPLTNALGADWRSHLTPERILELYARM